MQTLLMNRISLAGIIALAVSVIYLVLIYNYSTPGPEYYITIILFNFFIWINNETRRFMLALAVFVAFAMLYDIMKIFPNYLFNQVDIAEIYFFEKRFFGFVSEGILVTPNEYFQANHTLFLDLLSAFFYLNWMPVPLAFGLYLYFRNKRLYLNFALTFLLVNIIGFIGYYLYPAAPPWYVDLYGYELKAGIPGNSAGFERFDELIGVPVFGSLYSRNSNVFAAVPSLHCAYPLVVLYYGIVAKLGKPLLLLILFMTGIWFAAVYSGHHYVIDVILGVACALLGIIVYKVLFIDRSWYRKFLGGYLSVI
jgi:inositol phosphorylceramide synthase catalytic subunit